jgi:hypothetical protein
MPRLPAGPGPACNQAAVQHRKQIETVSRELADPYQLTDRPKTKASSKYLAGVLLWPRAVYRLASYCTAATYFHVDWILTAGVRLTHYRYTASANGAAGFCIGSAGRHGELQGRTFWDRTTRAGVAPSLRGRKQCR